MELIAAVKLLRDATHKLENEFKLYNDQELIRGDIKLSPKQH